VDRRSHEAPSDACSDPDGARTRDEPAKLGKLDNYHQEFWKVPLPQFIEDLYRKRFGKTVPDTVISIEERLQRDCAKKEARRTARQQRTTQVTQGLDQRWLDRHDFRLADEVQYIQRRAAERSGRIVTIGPLLLFSTESGDAWILDPADRLASRIAKDGVSTPAHIEETETGFAASARRICSFCCRTRCAAERRCTGR
jgi:hypothetical protein